LEIISLLLEIEQARFKHKFDYEIVVDEQVDIHHLQIPPLLLQPFVENAIWHGLLHKNDGTGKLSIRLDALPNGFRCIVEDNGIGRERAKEFRNQSVRKSKSFGVEISRERMALLSKHQFRDARLSFEDLTHADGAPAGTRVAITWQH
jgi:LytS/YehU family sensor histidine kinase